ncbi:MAG TPA: outer membrane lipoprotein chaperone LolA [Terriglobales bacterium]|nr:outer membrane lipoprotein chaperone LolA [Terriglobales bacterium]
MKRSVLIFVMCALAARAGAAERSVSDVAKAVDEHYNRLKSFTADFSESYRGAGIARSESGRLSLKKPGKMRWEYQQPRAKLFVTDGSTAYFYVPGDQQARRAPVKKLDDLRSPLRYLLGKTKLQKEFDGLELAPNVPAVTAGDIVLHGQPKSMADRVSDVVLEIAPDNRIVRILVEEVDGSTTEFRFSNIVEDPALDDAQFRFTPPPGVQVIEATDLAP